MRLPKPIHPGTADTVTGARRSADQNATKRPNYNPVQEVLSRLEKVKPSTTKRGEWIARCPAHDDKSPSLSIGEGRDGAVLVHCFGGCSAAEVLGAVGLRLGDLFPYDPSYYAAPRKRRIPPLDALICIDYEVLLVSVVASDILAGRGIDEETRKRLSMSIARIGAARESYR